MIDLFDPPKPPKAKPTYVHKMTDDHPRYEHRARKYTPEEWKQHERERKRKYMEQRRKRDND